MSSITSISSPLFINPSKDSAMSPQLTADSYLKHHAGSCISKLHLDGFKALVDEHQIEEAATALKKVFLYSQDYDPLLDQLSQFIDVYYKDLAPILLSTISGFRNTMLHFSCEQKRVLYSHLTTLCLKNAHYGLAHNIEYEALAITGIANQSIPELCTDHLFDLLDESSRYQDPLLSYRTLAQLLPLSPTEMRESICLRMQACLQNPPPPKREMTEEIRQLTERAISHLSIEQGGALKQCLLNYIETCCIYELYPKEAGAFWETYYTIRGQIHSENTLDKTLLEHRANLLVTQYHNIASREAAHILGAYKRALLLCKCISGEAAKHYLASHTESLDVEIHLHGYRALLSQPKRAEAFSALCKALQLSSKESIFSLVKSFVSDASNSDAIKEEECIIDYGKALQTLTPQQKSKLLLIEERARFSTASSDWDEEAPQGKKQRLS